MAPPGCASLVWDPYLKKDIEAIECVQKFGLKVYLKDWHCSYDNLLNVANIPTLASRRQQLELHQYFNIINAYSVFSDSLAARRVSPYLSSIRSTNPATLPQLFAHSYHFVSNSFFLSAISLWNTLPGDVCKIHSLSAFFFGSSWITRLVLMNVLLSGVTRNNKFII